MWPTYLILSQGCSVNKLHMTCPTSIFWNLHITCPNIIYRSFHTTFPTREYIHIIYLSSIPYYMLNECTQNPTIPYKEPSSIQSTLLYNILNKHRENSLWHTQQVYILPSMWHAPSVHMEIDTVGMHCYTGKEEFC